MAELLGVNNGKFTISTAEISLEELQDELNRAIANYGQVTERCAAEVAAAQARMDAANKNVELAKAVLNDGADFETAKAAINPAPIKPPKIEPVEEPIAEETPVEEIQP